MKVQGYLFLEGRCAEALEFYKKALGAEVGMVMKYKDAPVPAPDGKLPAGSENKVMHAEFKVGETTILASDGMCSGTSKFDGFALTVIVKDPAEAEKTFAGLGEGGMVVQGLMKTFFSPAFGMVKDKFGVMWMVYAAS